MYRAAKDQSTNKMLSCQKIVLLLILLARENQIKTLLGILKYPALGHVLRYIPT